MGIPKIPMLGWWDCFINRGKRLRFGYRNSCACVSDKFFYRNIFTRFLTATVFHIKRYSNNGRIVDAGDEYLSTSEWRNINQLFRIDKIH